MRYLALGAALLAALFLFSCLSAAQTGKRLDAVLDPLAQALSDAQAGDAAAARAHAAEAAAAWRSALPHCERLLAHAETDQITVDFAALTREAPESFPAACAALLSRLRHLKDADVFCIENLL